MTQTNNPTSHPRHVSLTTRMLIGAAVGLALVSFFVFTVDEADPAWGELWMIRPLIIVPFAGAMAGLCNYILLQFHYLAGISKTVAIIVSILVSLVGLWMGIVLGLDGTLWD
jgi:hypothetical protein